MFQQFQTFPCCNVTVTSLFWYWYTITFRYYKYEICHSLLFLRLYVFLYNRIIFIFKCHTQTVRLIPLRQKLGLKKEYFWRNYIWAGDIKYFLKGNFMFIQEAKHVYEYSLKYKLAKLLTKCNLLITLQCVDRSWCKHVPFSVLTDLLWLYFYKEWLQLLLFQEPLNPTLLDSASLEECRLSLYKFQNLKTSLLLWVNIFQNKMSYFMSPFNTHSHALLTE